MDINTSSFRPTELRMFNVLKDGHPHDRQEIHRCLEDQLSQLQAIQHHLSDLRKRLPRGYAILCEYHRRSIYYRLVSLVGSASRE